jgi:hypothetical protein
MRTKLAIIGIMICSWLFSMAAFGETEPTTQAEDVAQKYMTAFFHGDLELSFSLMHPDVLEQNKAMLLKAYEEAKQEGKDKEFRSQFQHVGDFDALLMLTAKDFFILLVTKDRERTPGDILEAMKEAVIDVLESSRLDDKTIQVILEVTTPTSTEEPHIEKVSLLLSQYEDEWRVMQ